MSPYDINYQPVNNYLKNKQSSQAFDLFGGGGGDQGGGGLGMNMDTMQLALGGIQTLGNLWNSFQAQGLAKEQFDFTKDITNTNLSNSIQSYNTSLTDRIRARAHTEGQSDSERDAYIEKNQLRRSY